jgi:Family of unknown function (DUF6064)
MSEWWTYSLSDFLLFSPSTYYRLFELYNRAIWPGQLLTVCFGVLILFLVRLRARWSGKVIALILAALWAWVAWAYLLERYETINWAASGFAAGFALQAALLLWHSAFGDLSWELSPDWTGRLGLGIFLFALGLYPVVGMAAGRPWSQAQIFGITPDPTVIATAGLLLTAHGRPRWLLLAIPLIWLSISTLTLWAMDSPEASVPLVAGLLAVALGTRKSWPKDVVRHP